MQVPLSPKKRHPKSRPEMETCPYPPFSVTITGCSHYLLNHQCVNFCFLAALFAFYPLVIVFVVVFLGGLCRSEILSRAQVVSWLFGSRFRVVGYVCVCVGGKTLREGEREGGIFWDKESVGRG